MKGSSIVVVALVVGFVAIIAAAMFGGDSLPGGPLVLGALIAIAAAIGTVIRQSRQRGG